jgi:hypothetical protein
MRGFTAIELMLTLGIIAVTAGVTIPMFRQYQMNADLDTATEHLVQALRGAETLSQAGKQDSTWGVYFQDGVLFAGDSYAERNPDLDVTFGLPPTIETSGLTEIVFSRPDGLPITPGTVYVMSIVTDAYREITIDASGVIRVSDVQHDIGAIDLGSSSSSSISSSDSSDTSSSVESSTSSSTSSSDESSTSSSTNSSTSSNGTGTSSSDSSASSSSTSSSGETGGGSSASSSSSSSSVSSSESSTEPSCDQHFSFDAAHNEITTVGTNDVKIKVLGSDIAYGVGGPKIPVRMSLSMDSSKTWGDLFSGRGVETDDLQTITNLPSNTSIRLQFNGRYSWLFNKTFASNGSDGHTVILRNGDALPNYAAFADIKSLKPILKKYVDKDGKIDIDSKSLLMMVELGTLDRTASFQSAFILVTFEQKAKTCTSAGKVKVKLHFSRIENTGTGNASNITYVGPQKIAFRHDQWIPLVDEDGTPIIDGNMVQEVPGLALERGDGWIHIVSNGSHPNSSGKELVNVTVEFNKAYISSTQNDTGANATENPTDGVINDTSAGDEFVSGPNAKSMIFYTRVTTQNDGVYLYWKAGEPSDAKSSSSSSSSTSSVASSSSSSTSSIDACAIPFDVLNNGTIVLGDIGDITVKMLGSQGTYGRRGPRLMVRARISFDGGSTWKDLYSGKSIRGNELGVFKNVAKGSKIVLSFNGRYSWVFNKSADSGRGDPHVRVLKNGSTFAGLYELVARGGMKSFLRNALDAYGRTTIGSREVAVLAELDDITNADYQDAVGVIAIDKAGGCASSSSSSVASSSSSSAVSSSSSSAVSSSSSSSSSFAANVDSDNDGIMNSDDVCPFDSSFPETVPTEQLTTGRYALTGQRGNPHNIPVYKIGPKNKVGGYSLADTKGCSCTQILDAIQGKGYNRFAEHPVLLRQMQNLFSFYVDDARKFGCSESLMKMVRDGK